MSETYEGAVNKTFEGKECVLYEVDNSVFLEGQTQMWDELVSENLTKILKETKINNLANVIKELERDDKIKIEIYKDTKEYKEKISKHILNLKKYSSIERQNNSDKLINEFGELVK